ncbi:hypothetical protein DRO69_08850 [Candidatus Bathyarchaeota archaeon]|nr:MAG: hypothetical protein DRO69_08850 [Candidatus Bathyarchaeota archaeon]
MWAQTEIINVFCAILVRGVGFTHKITSKNYWQRIIYIKSMWEMSRSNVKNVQLNITNRPTIGNHRGDNLT